MAEHLLRNILMLIMNDSLRTGWRTAGLSLTLSTQGGERRGLLLHCLVVLSEKTKSLSLATI